MSMKCDVQGEGSMSYKALISVQIAVQHTALLESWFFHLFGFGHDPIRCVLHFSHTKMPEIHLKV